MRIAELTAVATFTLLALGACGKSREAAADPEFEGLVELPNDPTAQFASIYATSSAQHAVEAVAKQFEPLRGGKVVPAFGSLDALVEQVKHGGAPGVVLGDGLDWLDRLDELGMTIPKTRVLLMTTTLVVVVPKGATLKPTKFEDLAEMDISRLAIAGRTAAGRHAVATIENRGIADAVKPRLVEADSDADVLAMVARGDADAGFVLATEAAACDDVTVALQEPASVRPSIVYAMVLTKGANRRTRRLWDFLKSDAAWKDFAKAGFAKPPK